ncbi:hypothetical protein Pelo_1602 [Pelomyxa schiedti]|nr:hypothetical protein Pelo_1602 [Pelomyxa schiedti]
MDYNNTSSGEWSSGNGSWDTTQLLLFVPLAFVTGVSSASLGITAWMLMVPVMMAKGWPLFTVLFVVGCMDLVTGTVMSCVYVGQRYIWKCWVWMSVTVLMLACGSCLIVGLLHEWISNHLSIFQQGSGVIAILFGCGFVAFGIIDIVKTVRRKKSFSASSSEQNHLCNTDRVPNGDCPEKDEEEHSLIVSAVSPPLDPQTQQLKRFPNSKSLVAFLFQKTFQINGIGVDGKHELDEEVNWIILHKFHPHWVVMRLLYIVAVFVCCLCVGYFGWGSGAFIVIILGMHTDIGLKRATGSGAIVMVLSTIVYLFNLVAWDLVCWTGCIGGVWQTLLCLVATQIAGSVVGTVLLLHIPVTVVKLVIGMVLLLVGIFATSSYYIMT